MKPPPASWLICTVATGVIGLTTALLSFPLAALVTMALLGAASVLLLNCYRGAMPAQAAIEVVAVRRADGTGAGGLVARRLADAALLRGLGLVSLLGLIALTHGFALVIVALLVATSLPLRAWGIGQWRSRHPRTPDDRPLPQVRRPLPGPAAPRTSRPELSDEALCHLWLASHDDLDRVEGAEDLHAVYLERAALLEEMERRNPAGFRNWLDSGPRAAGDPLRYLIRRPL